MDSSFMTNIKTDQNNEKQEQDSKVQEQEKIPKFEQQCKCLIFSSTCRLLTQFPVSVAMETSDASPIIRTTVVHSAIQREWNCTASGWNS